jgi:Flavodoxin-like fold
MSELIPNGIITVEGNCASLPLNTTKRLQNQYLLSPAMPTLLHFDASPRRDRSISLQLTRDFAAAWKQAHPDGQIIYRDLGHDPVPLDPNDPQVYRGDERRFCGSGWPDRNGARQT